MTRRSPAWFALVLVLTAPCPLDAQGRVDGIVIDSVTATGLDRARVRVVGGAVTSTDRFGRFTVTISFPARLIVARIGSRPDTLDLTEAPPGLLRVALVPVPVPIADLVVRAGGGIDPGLGEVGRWTVPKDGGGAPAVVARDVLRDLATLPAVTQTTVFNARPLIRGYDPGEVTLRLDGFDLPAPYHLARAFSSLPTEGVEQTSLITAPLDPSIGGTTGAAIDVIGRVGGGEGRSGGIGLTPVSIDGWWGGGDHLRGFLAGRITTVTTAAKLAGRPLGYGFKDAYGSVLLSPGDLPRVRFTGFISRDSAADRDEYAWMRWGTSLLGARADLWRRGGTRLEVSASYTGSEQVVRNFSTGNAVVDVDNHFSRTGFTLEWSRQGDHARLLVGLAPAWRWIQNRVVTSGSTVTGTDQDLSRPELGAFGALSHAVGAAQVDWGIRLDVMGPNVVWQPRVRTVVPLAPDLELEAGIGRSARLFHTVTDPHAMPDLLFYDLWLESGQGGVPVARVDHASAAVTWRRGGLSIRGAAYGSLGRGMVEIRPETDQQAGGREYRTGRSRTLGLEGQAGVVGARGSFTATYALTWSDRDWGGGWIPWQHDRRHLIRAAAQRGLGRWRLSVLAEFLSAPPLTPVAYLTGVDADLLTTPLYIYGAENSVRGVGTFRTDLGLAREFHGPWGSRGAFTFSVTNLTFGPAAPIAPVPTTEADFNPSNGVQYARLFDLPAIPSFGLRFEF